MTIGENIKALRVAKGWTQITLAEKSGISTNSIYKYENNTVMPRMPQAKAIAAALGVTYEGLMSGEESTTVDIGALDMSRLHMPDPDTLTLDGLTDEQRKALRVIVDSMKKEK